MAEMQFDPSRQLLGAQCSGTLVLAKLGVLNDVPACTDLITKPWVEETGVKVLNQPFFARDNVATAGGCLASQYLAAWVIARLEGIEAAESALHYVAPVGEKDEFVSRAMRNISPYLPTRLPGILLPARPTPGHDAASRGADYVTSSGPGPALLCARHMQWACPTS
jgi:hypothetical protein